MPRQTLRDLQYEAEAETPAIDDSEQLFPELNSSREHRDILEQARLLKAKKIAASKAKDKRDEVEQHLMEMMEAAGLPAFQFEGVKVRLKITKHASVRTARKDDPKVEDKGDGEDDE